MSMTGIDFVSALINIVRRVSSSYIYTLFLILKNSGINTNVQFKRDVLHANTYSNHIQDIAKQEGDIYRVSSRYQSC